MECSIPLCKIETYTSHYYKSQVNLNNLCTHTCDTTGELTVKDRDPYLYSNDQLA